MALWSVYLLRCADGSLYTGITNDLVRRLAAHNEGTASKYTRARLPVEVVCVMGKWRQRGPALKREARIKAMSREEKRALIRRKGATILRLRPARAVRHLYREATIRATSSGEDKPTPTDPGRGVSGELSRRHTTPPAAGSDLV